MALGIEQLDDFVASYLQKYPMGKWQDISSPLQEYMFASRLFDKANKREMSTSQCKWKLKIDNNDNFQVVGLYHRDSSSRKFDRYTNHFSVLILVQRSRFTRCPRNHQRSRTGIDMPVDQAVQTWIVDSPVLPHWGNECDKTSGKHFLTWCGIGR